MNSPPADPPQAGSFPTGGEVGLLADQIAAAVAGCPAVAALAAGPVATYLPGRVVEGVAVRGSGEQGSVQIAVIAHFGLSLPEVAAQVRAVATPLAPGLRIDIRIEDIDDAGICLLQPRPGPPP